MLAVDSHHGEESGEMYLPNEQGEYTLMDGTQAFTVQGLKDTLSGVRIGIRGYSGGTSRIRADLAVGSNDDGSSGSSMPTGILVECRHGYAHP